MQMQSLEPRPIWPSFSMNLSTYPGQKNRVVISKMFNTRAVAYMIYGDDYKYGLEDNCTITKNFLSGGKPVISMGKNMEYFHFAINMQLLQSGN